MPRNEGTEIRVETRTRDWDFRATGTLEPTTPGLTESESQDEALFGTHIREAAEIIRTWVSK